jgi:tetratricopeptide (TPR) repeat protein
VRHAQGDLSSALSSYQQGPEISQKLAARDPANTDRQRDLSVSYEKSDDVQSAPGDPSSALSSYQQGLEIAQKLAARDPANAAWQRDLSVSYNKIGDVRSAQGDLSSALSSYQQGKSVAPFHCSTTFRPSWISRRNASECRYYEAREKQQTFATALFSETCCFRNAPFASAALM